MEWTENQRSNSAKHSQTSNRFKEFLTKKPTVLALSFIVSVVALICLDNVFLPYCNYFEIGFILRYALYIFLLFVSMSAISAFFTNIGKFSRSEYIKSVILSGIVLHLLLAVRDAWAITDLSIPGKLFLVTRGIALRNIPVSVAALVAAVFLGMCVTRKTNE